MKSNLIRIIRNVVLMTSISMIVGGCGGDSPSRQQEKALDHLIDESRKLGKAEDKQTYIEKYVPGVSSDEVKTAEYRVEEARREVEKTARNPN
jgi:hypothetical protein